MELKEFEEALRELVIDGQGGQRDIVLGRLVVFVENGAYRMTLRGSKRSLDTRERSAVRHVVWRVLRDATRAGKGVVISGPQDEFNVGYLFTWVMVPSVRLMTLGKTARDISSNWLSSVEENAETDASARKGAPDGQNCHQQGTLF
jgi:hypothetical protein